MSTKRLFSIRVLRLSFVALLVARCLFSVASVAAAPSLVPLRIELSAPTTCPTTPTLFARVRTHTSRVREASPGENARVLRVDVTSHAAGFVADLHLIEDSDELERRVPGKTCDEVLEAVALIAALGIDAREATDVTTPDGPDAAPDAGHHEPIDTAPPRDRDAGTASPKHSNVIVSIGTSLEAQGLRSGAVTRGGGQGAPVVGASLWVEGALRTRLEPALRLRLARGRSFTIDEGGLPAIFRLSTAALEGCVRLNESRVVTLRPCAQVVGGVLEGASSAFGPAESQTRPWAALGALLQGRLVLLRPLSLEASIGFTAPLVRDDFFFRPSTAIYRAPPLLLVGDVGFGATFP